MTPTWSVYWKENEGNCHLRNERVTNMCWSYWLPEVSIQAIFCNCPVHLYHWYLDEILFIVCFLHFNRLKYFMMCQYVTIFTVLCDLNYVLWPGVECPAVKKKYRILLYLFDVTIKNQCLRGHGWLITDITKLIILYWTSIRGRFFLLPGPLLILRYFLHGKAIK